MWIKILIAVGITGLIVSGSSVIFFTLMECDPCDFEILINKNSKLRKYSSSGTGSQFDPYIIDSLNITTDNEVCITIVLVTDYFIIQNCYFSSPELGLNIGSIPIGRGKIINNTFVGCGFFAGSSGYTIENNRFIDNK